MEIVDAGTHYVIIHVEHNTPRRIWMDGRKAPADHASLSLGFSVGRWEGDELVIETTHLLPGWLDGSGLPMSGEGTRLVERYDFSDDRLAMDRTMTIYDPYYTQPLVRKRGSARGDDVAIGEQSELAIRIAITATCARTSYSTRIWTVERLSTLLAATDSDAAAVRRYQEDAAHCAGLDLRGKRKFGVNDCGGRPSGSRPGRPRW